MANLPAPESIDIVRWHSADGYLHFIEIKRVAELRRRNEARLQRPQRVEFFMLMTVTKGATDHVLDFETVPLRPGRWLLQKPGQMQRFRFTSSWDGWIVVFTPNFLPPALALGDRPLGRLVTHLERLPSMVALTPRDGRLCLRLVEQLATDARSTSDATLVGDLLLFQFAELVLRLRQAAPAAPAQQPAQSLALFQAFAALVETHYKSHHTVEWYGRQLPCSAKTLQRTVGRIAQTSVGEFIDNRRILEAKRLLSYTAAPVKAVADQLGFDDVSNFSRFFSRHTGQTPMQFRSG